jgi:hypothetical protein
MGTRSDSVFDIHLLNVWMGGQSRTTDWTKRGDTVEDTRGKPLRGNARY